jgi:saccharopine dehydrogenase-like NADP-dependent oxidoreductase
MSVLVFGAGRQGECLIYALKELGHDVFAVDQSISINVKELIPMGWTKGIDFQNDKDISDTLDDYENSELELVISCLPYFLNEKVAKACIDRKIPYFDLGGHVGTSAAINAYSVENDGQVFTDLGLAPGWVNIMAEDSYRRINQIDEVQAIQMFCGGLPTHACGLHNPPFNYGRTWSSEGLLNEYKDDCFILKYGKVETVSGMSGIEDHDGGWEAFHTSGGIGKSLDLMKNRGVKFCTYKTLRGRGHIEPVQSLIEAGFGVEFFDKLFPVITKDYVRLEARANGKNSYYRNTQSVYSDDRFTAMQKATAFPVASVAHMFLNDTHEGLYINSRDYSHVDYEEFTETLGGLLGIEL